MSQVLFDLTLERQPVGLDQFVECCFFGFVALIVIGLGIGYRHLQIWCLQRPWPVRMALLTAALARWSGITTWLFDDVRRDQVCEPFLPFVKSS